MTGQFTARALELFQCLRQLTQVIAPATCLDCPRRADFLRQMLGPDQPVIGKQARPFQNVAQLANVAREWMQPKLLQSFVAQPGRRLASHALQQALGEQGQVFYPFAQRRQTDWEAADAVVQVFAEAAVRDHLPERFMGRRHQAEIRMHRAQATHRAEAAGLDQAQQLHLHRQRYLANFIEEQSAAMRRFSQADLALVGASERALLVAEQLALEQRLGQAGTVDHHQWAVGPGAAHVHRTGEQFLAGT